MAAVQSLLAPQPHFLLNMSGVQTMQGMQPGVPNLPQVIPYVNYVLYTPGYPTVGLPLQAEPHPLPQQLPQPFAVQSVDSGSVEARPNNPVSTIATQVSASAGTETAVTSGHGHVGDAVFEADTQLAAEIEAAEKQKPCTHNSWENVRVRRGRMCIRCRVCQRQWTCGSQLAWQAMRCRSFLTREGCHLGDMCTKLHFNRRKQQKHERLNFQAE
eukprot:Rhum_TRINITY_DN13689_c0_g1::Rhum_TRINITY_DN13689_c0_g1_i1::g.62977::m.62977